MIADAAHVRLVGNLPAGVSTGMISPHLRTARNRLTLWVGATNYEKAETEVAAARAALVGDAELDIDALSVLSQALIDAEAFLALNHGLPSFNTVMNDDAGITVQGQVGDNGATFSYLSPGQVLGMQKMYLRNAELSAAAYIEASDLGPGISKAYDDDNVAID